MTGFSRLLAISVWISGACTIQIDGARAQCCSGGSASPIAGGTSQGVLPSGQIEISTYFQFADTKKFYNGSKPDTGKTFDGFSSRYQYLRLAYGLSGNFTMSVESGFYLSKKQTGLNGDPETTYESKGLADIILFPRYDVISRMGERHRTGATVGLGYKIPVGSHNDSTGLTEPFSGETYYNTKPQSVQLTSGAQDIIFFVRGYREFLPGGLRLSANALYIKKGWNANAERLGDYASLSLFAGKTFFGKMGATVQLRYERVDSMEINESVLLFGNPSTYYPGATGYKKVFISPQISYTGGPVTVFASTDIPVYQYVNSDPHYSQAASQYLLTFGLTYRFNVPAGGKPDQVAAYSCPMHPEITSPGPALCKTCGMDLVKIGD